MTEIEMIRELDRLYVIAKATRKTCDWSAYFQTKAAFEEQFGRPARRTA